MKSDSDQQGSSELLPTALVALREEFEAEAEARRERFTQAFCCLNISSTQYRTFVFFEVVGLLATALLFAAAEMLKAHHVHDP